MNLTSDLLAFQLDGQRYALQLPTVKRVVRVVGLTPLPGAPPTIRGVISVQGTLIPVGDLRRRLGLREREISLSDQIVIARSPRRMLGFLTEGDTEIVSCTAAEIVSTKTVVRGADAIAGIARLPNGLILIHDLALFLSLEEERLLAEAMQHD